MPINWQEIITTVGTTVGGSGVLIASIAWLTKGVVSNRFARDAEKFKIEIKANADTEIERVKAFLIRASRVHERQLDILANLYRHLYEAQGLFQRMTSAARSVGEITREQYELLLGKAMEAAQDELVRGRLFIPQELAHQCVSFFNVVFKGQLNFSFYRRLLVVPSEPNFGIQPRKLPIRSFHKSCSRLMTQRELSYMVEPT